MLPNRPPPRRRVVLVSTGVAGLVALSGCTQLSASVNSESSAAVVVSNPGPDTANIDPETPIVIAAQNGRLTHVQVVGPKGKSIKGSIDETGMKWISTTKVMEFNSEYKIQAIAVDDEGLEAPFANAFRTLKPKNTVEATVRYIWDGSEVGVGMPIQLDFDAPVKNKQEIEEHLFLYASKPVVGAWSWSSDSKRVTFRPEKFWPGHTRIALDARLYGAQAAKGFYGVKNVRLKFATGPSMVSTVDTDRYSMQVVRDGKKVMSIPITAGKAGFETRSGTKVIMAKEGTVRMSDPTLQGSGEFYQLDVPLAMRLTWSGEFLHAAPWSTGSQGWANVSHGCIGMSWSNASWMYSNSLVGDVVVVKNTGRSQDLGNGITDWNVPWKTWLKNSATKIKQVGPGPLVAAPKPDKPADKVG